MRLPGRIHTQLLLVFGLQALTRATSFNCKEVLRDGIHFNFGELAGRHNVHWISEGEPSITNFTFTLDICQSLPKLKSVPAKEQCEMGTRICGVKTVYEPGREPVVEEVHNIAGSYPSSSGRTIDPIVTILKQSDHSSEEGARIEFHGGRYPSTGKYFTPQKAVVDFLCDKNRTGLEGDEEDNREIENVQWQMRAKDNLVHVNDDDSKSLRFISWGRENDDNGDNVDVLRMKWLTKYACLNAFNENTESSGSWGFFTWFIIVLFLAVAAYLVFGSWLNYTRYDARGWDLLPHGDTIRDCPYLLKDWARRVMGTLEGTRSRGGYSAV